jgi:hypothetical protein
MVGNLNHILVFLGRFRFLCLSKFIYELWPKYSLYICFLFVYNERLIIGTKEIMRLKRFNLYFLPMFTKQSAQLVRVSYFALGLWCCYFLYIFLCSPHDCLIGVISKGDRAISILVFIWFSFYLSSDPSCISFLAAALCYVGQIIPFLYVSDIYIKK